MHACMTGLNFPTRYTFEVCVLFENLNEKKYKQLMNFKFFETLPLYQYQLYAHLPR